ncbi:hypothetical protein SeLEV6574_g03866 [Synchytrium endobioticum]|nr:hypothetical protein SeLEV6574_g03866 [Synchytrium endobioticum]
MPKRKIVDDDDGRAGAVNASSPSSAATKKKKKTAATNGSNPTASKGKLRAAKREHSPDGNMMSGDDSLLVNELSDDQRMVYLELLRHPKGVPQKDLDHMFPSMDSSAVMQALNQMSARRIVEFQQEGQYLRFLARSDNEYRKTRDLSPEEYVVYGIIKNKGNRGIWVRHIKEDSKLKEKVVLKCLDRLTNQMLIKSLTSVKHKTRKLYMLAEITPSVELTGGVFFTDQEFDSDMVESIALATYSHILRKTFHNGLPNERFGSRYEGYATAQTCLEFVKKSNLLKDGTELSIGDILRILSRLIYDDKIIKYRRDGKPNEPTASSTNPDDTGHPSKSIRKAPSKKNNTGAKTRNMTDDSDDGYGDAGGADDNSDMEASDAELDNGVMNVIGADDDDDDSGGYGVDVDTYIYEAIRPSDYPEDNDLKVGGLGPTSAHDRIPSYYFPIEYKVNQKEKPTLKGSMWGGRWTPMTAVPCGTCPVASFCRDDGPVNPGNCTYMADWIAEW